MYEQVETIKRKVKAARFVMSEEGFFERKVVWSAQEVIEADARGDYYRMNAAGFDHEQVELDWGGLN